MQKFKWKNGDEKDEGRKKMRVAFEAIEWSSEWVNGKRMPFSLGNSSLGTTTDEARTIHWLAMAVKLKNTSQEKEGEKTKKWTEKLNIDLAGSLAC